MSRISGHTTGNEGLDRSLAELAETIRPGSLMAIGYRANVEPAEHEAWEDEADSSFEQALAEAELCKRCEKKLRYA